MICPNCGKDCSEEEIFCRQCGTKIRTAPKTEDSANNTDYTDDSYNIVAGINRAEDEDLEHILNRDLRANNAHEESLEEPEVLGKIDEEDMGVIEASHKDAGKKYSSKDFKNTPPRNSNKKKKTKLILILSLIAVLVGVLGTVLFFYISRTSSFNKFYSTGKKYYNAKNYRDSRTQLLNARDNAFTSGQKIQALDLLYTVDELIGGKEIEEIESLETLVELDEDNIDYYKNLIILYQNNDMDKKIDDLIKSAPSSLQAELKDFDGTIPTCNEEGGKKVKPISVELSATSDVKIYYTIDGSKVSDSTTRKEYTNPIKFNREGNYILRAASKDKNGKYSKELKVKYEIDFVKINTPTVNLDSGKYSEQKKIEVSCDDGCEIYYTKDGTTPTKKSKKYKKAIKMPKGSSLYYFIAINEDGISSEVVTRAFEYAPKYSYSYDDALSALSVSLVSSGKFEDENGTFKNGDEGYINYKSTEEIDGAFYYVVQVEIDNKKGNTKSTDYYGISTDSGDIEKLKRSGGSYSFK